MTIAQFSTSVRKVAVLTSGGDAPGMNAAIRSTVRTAIDGGLEIFGVYHGFKGLLNREISPLSTSSVANIIQTGGTILKTERCREFLEPQVRKSAVEILRGAGIDALVCIGGDGTFRGAHLLWKEHQFPVIGVPGTIDNDIVGTDFTIGFDTAINTALDCIDRIRDTAASHNRLFIVEVMGRNSGFIALAVGLACGAEEIFIPERPVVIDRVVDRIRQGMDRGKKSSILVAAEGQKPGRAYDLAEAIRKRAGFEAKVCVLGHIQRGGKPTATDRNMASRMSFGAIQALQQRYCDAMVAIQSGQIQLVPLETTFDGAKKISFDLLDLVQILSK